MATNRVIVDPNGRQFSCDSMDRFGDDLCQLIVGYLPFEDKTRLEGVAKQWRRVMDYNGIKTLWITKGREYKVSEFGDSLVFNWRSDAQKEYKHLKKLFDKCLNIRKIRFNEIHINCPLIEVIDKYCQRLESLEIIGCQLSEEAITLIGCDLGPKVKRFAIDSYGYRRLTDEAEKQLLANCPNIESLKCRSFSVFSDRSDDFLPKLKSLKTTIDAKNVSLFPDFVHKYQKQLKSLTFKTSDFDRISVTQFKDVLNAISLLKDINDLEIRFYPYSSEDQLVINIDRQLQQIGRKCGQLKRFSSDIYRNSNRIEGNIWRNLFEFQALESLELNFDSTVDQFIALMGLMKNLKKIFVEAFEAKEEMFANIHRFVPNLKSFTFRTNTVVTDKLLDSLSHLNHLKEIFIDTNINTKKITESGVNRLLDNCPQLTRFEYTLWTTDCSRQTFVTIEKFKREKPLIHWREYLVSESE